MRPLPVLALPLVLSGLLACASGPQARGTSSSIAQDPDPVATESERGVGPGAPTPASEDPTGPVALRAHVEFLCGLEPARSVEHPASLRLAADHVAEAFAAAGARVERQRFEVDGEPFQNVRAFLGPEGGPRLVVGAHYDCCGDQPGADDNASAVAVLLALAHALRGVELRGSVELVAYTLEEPPHFAGDDMGSAHHVRALVAEEVELVGMVCLEMLGCFSDEEGSQTYPLEALAEGYGTVGDYLAVVGRPEDADLVRSTSAAFRAGLASLHAEWDRAAADIVHGERAGGGGTSSAGPDALAPPPRLRIVDLVAPRGLTGMDFSDHRNFWDAGRSAVMVTDTAFFRNPRYHTAEDTPDTLDYGRMAQSVHGLRSVVEALARGGLVEGK